MASTVRVAHGRLAELSRERERLLNQLGSIDHEASKLMVDARKELELERDTAANQLERLATIWAHLEDAPPKEWQSEPLPE